MSDLINNPEKENNNKDQESNKYYQGNEEGRRFERKPYQRTEGRRPRTNESNYRHDNRENYGREGRSYDQQRPRNNYRDDYRKPYGESSREGNYDRNYRSNYQQSGNNEQRSSYRSSNYTQRDGSDFQSRSYNRRPYDKGNGMQGRTTDYRSSSNQERSDISRRHRTRIGEKQSDSINYNTHREQGQGGYRNSNYNRNYDGNRSYQQRSYRDGDQKRWSYNERPNKSGDFDRPNYQNNSNRPRQYGNSPRFQKTTRPKFEKPTPIKFKEFLVDPNEPIRLNKFLANAGVCSRREADEFIQAGLVTVNGEVITELGTKITRQDTVCYKDQQVNIESKVYILLNKPKNCVTTSDDPEERRTVMDLVKNACEERIFPVGRLDRNTTGILLITNDGELAAKLTHPSFKKKKIYHVWLDRDVDIEDMKRIASGIELEDGEIHADAISYASETDKSQVGIEIHSGKNRIVRRIFETLGYKVRKLDRVYFAGLTKKNLPRGKWRFLNEQEVSALRMGAFE